MFAQCRNVKIRRAQNKRMQFIKGSDLDGLDRCAFDIRVTFKGGFDFAALDPVSANFDLMINAAQIFDCTVAAPAPQIAGAIQAASR